jgi:hypothetical protein
MFDFSGIVTQLLGLFGTLVTSGLDILQQILGSILPQG